MVTHDDDYDCHYHHHLLHIESVEHNAPFLTLTQLITVALCCVYHVQQHCKSNKNNQVCWHR